MILESMFKPAWWLSNNHAQTIYGSVIRNDKSPIDKEERFELPDGDFLNLSWAINGLDDNSPLIVLLHGLGGSVNSMYMAGLLQKFKSCGWRAVVMHFRGAGSEPNRQPRAYHCGDTGDLDCFLRMLSQREGNTKKAVVGVSLGGNVLLKWLGEQGAQSLVDVAVAVSVPFELRLVADRINQGFSKFYQHVMLKRLRPIFERKKQLYANTLPAIFNNLNTWNCFWTFDDKVTAPLHGYPHVHAYYREASSRQYLINIKTPTFIIHSLDDPFMTPAVIPTESELSKDISLEITKKGGHVGFISGNIPGKPIYWLDERVAAFLKDYF